MKSRTCSTTFYLLQETGRIEENEYAYVDEFAVIPRAAVWDNTLNHRRDQLLVEQGYASDSAYPREYTYTGTLSRDSGLYSKDNSNASQRSNSRSHSVGSMGPLRGNPPQYFTLEPAGPDIRAPNSCLTAIHVPQGGIVGDSAVDNHYQIQDTLPKQLQTFRN